MKNTIFIILLSGVFVIFLGCFGGSKEKLPTITCQIVCDSTNLLPKTNTEFAIASFDITIDNVVKYPSNSSPTDNYEHILIIPKDTRAVIDNKTYFISVKKKFEKFMGKEVHKLPSTFIGKPDNIEKGEFYSFTAKDTDLIDNILNLIHKSDVFYNSDFEHAIKIMQFPDIDADLRTYNVQQIFITEYFIQIGQTVTIEGEIVGDTLFLLY